MTTPRAHQAAAASSQASAAATVCECARCRCDLRARARAAEESRRVLLGMTFTMTQANGTPRPLCPDCWLKESSGDGELLGTPARSERR
jgi:hypothetical protein